MWGFLGRIFMTPRKRLRIENLRKDLKRAFPPEIDNFAFANRKL